LAELITGSPLSAGSNFMAGFFTTIPSSNNRFVIQNPKTLFKGRGGGKRFKKKKLYSPEHT
jgi:hypothetical protein